ncbi:MAG: phosphoribosylamine--glycine ligase [Pseudomonadota bacterium]
MRILVVGSGGREHALCWSIAASPLCDALFCAPGNAGIAQEATLVDIAAEDVDALVAFAKRESIDLVVVGPEAPLVLGLADRLAEAGIKAFGPSQKAAVLEGSKAFMKALCDAKDIPTAEYRTFTEVDAAKAYVRTKGAPIVIKADGLATGKGVSVASTVEQAEAAIDQALTDQVFGDAGSVLVIEEFLEGPEISYFALADGKTILPLASAQDYKRAHDNDEGPNTGGMGAFSPSPLVDSDLERRILKEIIKPTVEGLAEQDVPFLGVLYAGLVLTADGPKLLEYNVRFGDPECQVLMMRLKSDLVPALLAACDGQLKNIDLRWYDDSAVCVVMATNGYPGAYEKGSIIKGISAADGSDEVTVFHAATRQGEDNRIEAHGGRVLGVTAHGDDLATARDLAYQAVDQIDWPEGYCRKDIAASA